MALNNRKIITLIRLNGIKWRQVSVIKKFKVSSLWEQTLRNCSLESRLLNSLRGEYFLLTIGAAAQNFNTIQLSEKCENKTNIS